LNPTLVHSLRNLQRNILAGIITIAPLFVTYVIFSFLLGILAKAGLPLIWILAYVFPEAQINAPWVQFVLAVVLTLVVLYAVGSVTSAFAGRRALALFESALERLPLVAKIYGSVRQLTDNMMAKKESAQRVVLVDFPFPGHKCIGFLSRTMTDSVTGQELAAVLLPNAINPTSAFLQLLPIERIVETDLTMEQAMSMLLTGGAVGPETLRFSKAENSMPAAVLMEDAIAEGSAIVIVSVDEGAPLSAEESRAESRRPANPPAEPGSH
jgi:uncharacterized membrane protein